MKLAIISIFILFMTLMFQNIDGGSFFDFFTPLLVSVGLVSNRVTSVIWLICISFLWSAMTRCSFLMLFILWGFSLWALRIISREIEWKKPIILFFISAVFSFLWQAGALMIMWANGIKPTIDKIAILSFIFRMITSGIITAIFWSFVFKYINPHHHLLREN